MPTTGPVAPDHRALGELVKRVGHALERLRQLSSPPVALAKEAGELVELFGTELQRHFASEESEQGFFADVIARAPRLDRPLRKLRKEHRAMTHSLKSLVDAARWAGVSSKSWLEVADRFDELAADLGRHETLEDSLVAEALNDDEGGSG